jgi:hypothetical protein
MFPSSIKLSSYSIVSLCPLFTRKLSVLDPGKGVCADPRGGDATLGAGGPGPQWETMSVSWVWTGEVRRHYEISASKVDDPITASRNDHAQSKCHQASVSNSVNIHHKHCVIHSVIFYPFGHSTLGHSTLNHSTFSHSTFSHSKSGVILRWVRKSI